MAVLQDLHGNTRGQFLCHCLNRMVTCRCGARQSPFAVASFYNGTEISAQKDLVSPRCPMTTQSAIYGNSYVLGGRQRHYRSLLPHPPNGFDANSSMLLPILWTGLLLRPLPVLAPHSPPLPSHSLSAFPHKWALSSLSPRYAVVGGRAGQTNCRHASSKVFRQTSRPRVARRTSCVIEVHRSASLLASCLLEGGSSVVIVSQVIGLPSATICTK
jgi:hypothetical protein